MTASTWKAQPEGADYDAVRGQLVEAAESVIRDEGMAGLKLDAVARRAGLHRSSVYRYFDSKQDLVLAVVIQASLRIGGEVIDAIGEEAEPEEFVVRGIIESMAAMAEDPVLGSLLAPASTQAMNRQTDKALISGVRPLIEPMFSAAAERGVLRTGVSPDDAIRWLQIVAMGIYRSPGVVADSDELRRLLELMLVPALTTGRAETDGAHDALDDAEPTSA